MSTIKVQNAPQGGCVQGYGLNIVWQHGLESRNGAYLQDVIVAALQRVEYLQKETQPCCQYVAISHHLTEALKWCNDRDAQQLERKR